MQDLCLYAKYGEIESTMKYRVLNIESILFYMFLPWFIGEL